jgi:hypothetical protein
VATVHVYGSVPPSAVSDPEYAAPTAPVAGSDPVIASPAADEIAIVRLDLAVLFAESVSVIATTYSPAVVGVPATLNVDVFAPAAVTPPGRLSITHVYGAIPPVAVNVPE